MKKLATVLAAACCAVFLAVGLVGCGGDEGGLDEQGRADFVWFKAEIPGGFELSDYHGSTCADVSFEAASGKEFYPFITTGTADSYIEGKLDIFDDWKQGEDVTYGDYTWKTIDFTWNGNPSVDYVMDYNGVVVVIDAFEMARGDQNMETFLNSIELPENIEEALGTARETESNTIVYKAEG